MKSLVGRLVILGLCAAGLWTCGGTEVVPEKKGRVVILGFDGVEPSLVQSMMDAGELPNLARLGKEGAFRPLGSTIPPQSPAAWSSFATCTSPGDHGVFDFLRRDVHQYLPMPGYGVLEHPKLTPDGEMLRQGRGISVRKGKTFWKAADEQGAKTKVLRIPFSFPPDELNEGIMLCGEGVPDIRGMTSTFFSLSDGFTPEQLKEDVLGGVRLPLTFEGDVARVSIPGAVDARRESEPMIEVPIAITVDRAARKGSVDVQGQVVPLEEGRWTDWVGWSFPIGEEFHTKAISAFYVLEMGERVRLYMTSLQFDPREPYAPFTTPREYASELAERYGLYKTLGWSHDTHALRKDALPDDAFLEDGKKMDAWIETLTLDEIDRDNFDLLVAVWTSPDRVSHTFWRFRDPKHPLYTEEGAKKYGQAVEDTYRRMDAIVGKVMTKLRPDDLLMVMSDHGFHSFRKAFSVNTWLVRNGYLAVKGQTDPATAATTAEASYLQGFDWGRSKAYSVGLGSIYLNLAGREGQGIVAPADATAVAGEIREKLLAVTDPETGDRVFNRVYTREVFAGAQQAHAPDLQLGYAEGYQTAKESARGGAPAEVFEPNLDKWSGEHASSDVESTPGILFANREVKAKPTLVDLGVTALDYLGLTPPETFKGQSILE